MKIAISLALLSLTTLTHAELIINGQPISVSNLNALSDNTSFYQNCWQNLQPAAQRAGISAMLYTQLTQNLSPNLPILDNLNTQPEFKTAIWDYLAPLVDAERIHDGQQRLAQHQQRLQQIYQQYGVEPAALLAVWGIESNYGQIVGKNDLIQSLGTLSCAGRRQAFFRGEWFAAMRLLQRGDVHPEQLKGSWAGAFGQTQFMPSTYERLAVDFDGDGRRDLVSSTADALASTANFLKRAGWQTGQPWGFEVAVPDDFSMQSQGRQQRYRLGYFSQHGLRRVDGSPLVTDTLADSSLTNSSFINNTLTENTLAALIAPAGAKGPKFLVLQNFNAFYQYNAAESYALALALLSDQILAKPSIKQPWPTQDLGTSRAERREIQHLLLGRGYDIGQADGLIGSKTRAAIVQEQQRLGLMPDGRAGQMLLQTLRSNLTKP